MKNNILKCILPIVLVIFIVQSCQKMQRPALSNYPKDANAPGGPLSFYAAFDGTGKDPLMNAVDSIRATFPVDNPAQPIDGIRGKAFQTGEGKFIKYSTVNDFAQKAESFTVAFWEKRNGMPIKEAEFPFSISSNNGHWAGTTMMLLFDHDGAGATNESAVIKFVVVDKSMDDTWLTWEGDNKIVGIQDNKWHHLAFVYDAGTSQCILYIDGVAKSNNPQWVNHGKINLDPGKVTSFQIGGRPKEDLGWGRSWVGGLDQFRLYAKALTAAEVKELYNGKR